MRGLHQGGIQVMHFKTKFGFARFCSEMRHFGNTLKMAELVKMAVNQLSCWLRIYTQSAKNDHYSSLWCADCLKKGRCSVSFWWHYSLFVGWNNVSVLFQRAKKDFFRHPFAICPRGSLPARAIKWAQFINCSHIWFPRSWLPVLLYGFTRLLGCLHVRCQAHEITGGEV